MMNSADQENIYKKFNNIRQLKQDKASLINSLKMKSNLLQDTPHRLQKSRNPLGALGTEGS